MSPWWLLAVVPLVVIAVWYAGVARRMGRLFAQEHLHEAHAAAWKLRADALQGGVAKAVTTAPASFVYTISADEPGATVHHLSFATPLSPAVAASTFFMALLLETLRLPAGRRDVFVSQTRTLHFVLTLPKDEHDAWARADAPTPFDEVRAKLAATRDVLLREVQHRDVPLPLPTP